MRHGLNPDTGVWAFEVGPEMARHPFFLVLTQMVRHPVKMPLGALMSAWPFLVQLEMARHPCPWV